MISWKPEFETGIATIDAQHQGLFKAMGELQSVLEKSEDREQIQHCLRFLLLYCEIHMQEEELLFRTAGIPGVAEHAMEHRALIDAAYDLNYRWTEGEPGLLPELLNFLRNRLVKHIQDADRKMALLVGPDPKEPEPATPHLMPPSWIQPG